MGGMFGIGPSPLAVPLLIGAVALWVRLFWPELRQNRVSWLAFAFLVVLLIAWAWLTSRSNFI